MPCDPQPWYVAAFGRHYLRLYAHRDEADARRAAAFAVRVLALRPRARLLDLCCGAGRHLRALREAGFHAVGLDLSPELLAAAAAKGRGSVVRGDMRALPFADASFDAVLSFFTSFGYFLPDGENLRVFREVRRTLRPGGGFLLDFLNREYVLTRGLGETREEREGWVIVQRRRWCPERDTVEKDVVIHPARRPETRWAYRERVRLYSADQVRAFLRRAGLAPGPAYGSFAGDAFRPDSPRFIATATKDDR